MWTIHVIGIFYFPEIKLKFLTKTITKRNICSALTLHARFRVSWSTFFFLRFDGLIAFFSGNRQEKIACEVWGVKRQVLLQNESNFFLSYKARLARNERTIFVEWTTTKHDLYHLSSCLKHVFADVHVFEGALSIPESNSQTIPSASNYDSPDCFTSEKTEPSQITLCFQLRMLPFFEGTRMVAHTSAHARASKQDFR